MQYTEFCDLAGVEIDFEIYRLIVEPKYMHSDLDKYDFVKSIDWSKFKDLSLKTLEDGMAEAMYTIYEDCVHCDCQNDLNRLEELINRFASRIRSQNYFLSMKEKDGSSCYYPEKVTFYSNDGSAILTIEMKKTAEPENVANIALCEGRHEIPEAKDGAIFENTLNPLDLKGMRKIAEEKLKDVEHLNLYVTGLTVALVEVLNVCMEKSIAVTLWHFDRESGGYYLQEVSI